MTCHACGAPLAATAKFCHKCGAQVGGGQAPGWWGGRPWGVAGAALGALLAVLALRIGRSREPGAVPDGARGGTAAGSLLPAPDISQMSPEERATRLYNRVMTLHSQGKADSAEFFLPMALQAYAMLPALDIDGRYHIGVLDLTGGDYAGALAQADSIHRAVRRISSHSCCGPARSSCGTTRRVRAGRTPSSPGTRRPSAPAQHGRA